MSEKTEKASHYKLLKSQEKGQVNKSIELNIQVTFVIILAYMSWTWEGHLTKIKLFCRSLLVVKTTHCCSQLFIIDVFQEILFFILNLWAPIVGILILSLILINWLQSGLVWTSHPLIPNFKRLNISQGLKKIISLKNVFELGKTLFKILGGFVILVIILKDNLSGILNTSLIQITYHPSLFAHLILKVAFHLLAFLLIIALIDLLYSRWSFAKEQRMSKHDIKEEYKQREGDPKVKSKIKQLQRELRRKTTSLQHLKNADVIITNPTHLAIALAYDRNTMPAPKVVCKAQDMMVIEVKKIARKYGIPIIENKILARLLFHSIELNHWISQELYPLTAMVFRDLYAQGKQS